MDFFTFKKLIAVAVMPINIAIVLLIISAIFYQYKPRLALKSLFIALLTLIIPALPPVADHFAYKLEQTYESFSLSAKPVDYIIVLGCGHQSNDALSVTSQLKPCSLQRLLLWRLVGLSESYLLLHLLVSLLQPVVYLLKTLEIEWCSHRYLHLYQC